MKKERPSAREIFKFLHYSLKESLMLDGIVRNIIILLFYPIPESPFFLSFFISSPPPSPPLSLSPSLSLTHTFYLSLFSTSSHHVFLTFVSTFFQRFYPCATLQLGSRHRVLKKPGYYKYLLHHLPSFWHKAELLALIEYATETNNGVFILFTELENAISQKNSINAIQN